MSHKLAAYLLGLMFGTAIGVALVSGHRAREARLVGMCQGRMMARMEESDFPQGCDWIERIRYR